MWDSSPPGAPSFRGKMVHGGLLPTEVVTICGACVRLALELLGLGTGMWMGLREGGDTGVCAAGRGRRVHIPSVGIRA